MPKPRVWGDAQDVVVELHLDYQGFEWLVNELEHSTGRYTDQAVVELRELLTKVEAERA